MPIAGVRTQEIILALNSIVALKKSLAEAEHDHYEDLHDTGGGTGLFARTTTQRDVKEPFQAAECTLGI